MTNAQPAQTQGSALAPDVDSHSPGMGSLVSLAVAVVVGTVVGVCSATFGPIALAAGTIVAIPMAAWAAGGMTGAVRNGLIVLGLAATFALDIHRGPDITAFEPIVLVTGALIVARSRPVSTFAWRERMYRLFLITSGALLALGLLYSLWSPAHLGVGASRKELGKNLEVFGLAFVVLAYVGDVRRFSRAYALLAFGTLVNAVRPVFAEHGRALRTDSFMTEAPLLFIVLALPFARRVPVAFLVGAAGAELVLARTRGAWIAALLIVLLIASRPRLRQAIGRAGVTALGIGAVVLVTVVLLLPSLRVRVNSLITGHDQSVNTRLSMLHGAELETETFPFTGVGPGHFKDWLVVKHDPIGFRIGVTEIPKDPHDTFAKFSAEMGLPGLILHLGWVVAVVGSVWVAWLRFRGASSSARPLDPFITGLTLYAPLYVLLLLLSEWGSLTRVNLALAAGLFLGLLRLVPQRAVCEAE